MSCNPPPPPAALFGLFRTALNTRTPPSIASTQSVTLRWEAPADAIDDVGGRLKASSSSTIICSTDDSISTYSFLKDRKQSRRLASSS